MMEHIWKLLVAVFWLLAAAVLLLIDCELRSTFIFVAAIVLAFVGFFAGLLAIVDHRESKKEQQQE